MNGINSQQRFLNRIVLEQEIISRDPLVFEFGCGAHKHDASAIGVDLIPYESVDIVADALDVLHALPNLTADKIYSSHFIEHLGEPARYVRECARVLKVGGLFETVAPHWSNPYFYSDPTHRSFGGLYSMCYFADSDAALLRRKVPRYEELSLRIIDVELVFGAAQEFTIRHFLKSFLGWPINSCRWAKEFYEGTLSRLTSCSEIRFLLAKV